MFHVNNIGMNKDSCEQSREYNSTPISKSHPKCMDTEQIVLLCSKACIIQLLYSKVMELTHMAE